MLFSNHYYTMYVFFFYVIRSVCIPRSSFPTNGLNYLSSYMSDLISVLLHVMLWNVHEMLVPVISSIPLPDIL